MPHMNSDCVNQRTALSVIPHSRFRARNMPGFTLIELLIVIAIAAVLLTVGVPSLKYSLEVNQLAAQTNRVVSALHLTRSEAVKRNARVTVCKSADGLACSTDAGVGWEDGWIVFVDDGAGGGTVGDSVVNGSEPLINTEGASEGQFTFTAPDFVSFGGDGTSRTGVDIGSLVSRSLTISLSSQHIDEPSRCLDIRNGGGITRSEGVCS